MTTLIVVDVQNDFCEGGALPIQGGNKVAERIVEYLGKFGALYQQIIFTQDWHDALGLNGGHFSDTPDYKDTWPDHCIANTHGAELHESIWKDYLAVAPHNIFIARKGQGKPAYSAFEASVAGTPLPEIVADTNLFHVCGLAYDYCVQATALDAYKLAPTIVLSDLTASVSRNSEIEATARMAITGIGITTLV